MIWVGSGVGEGTWVGGGVGVRVGTAVSVGGNWVGVSVAFGVAEDSGVLVGVSIPRVCPGFVEISSCWGLQETNKIRITKKGKKRFFVISLNTNSDYIAEDWDYGNGILYMLD